MCPQRRCGSQKDRNCHMLPPRLHSMLKPQSNGFQSIKPPPKPPNLRPKLQSHLLNQSLVQTSELLHNHVGYPNPLSKLKVTTMVNERSGFLKSETPYPQPQLCQNQPLERKPQWLPPQALFQSLSSRCGSQRSNNQRAQLSSIEHKCFNKYCYINFHKQLLFVSSRLFNSRHMIVPKKQGEIIVCFMPIPLLRQHTCTSTSALHLTVNTAHIMGTVSTKLLLYYKPMYAYFPAHLHTTV